MNAKRSPTTRIGAMIDGSLTGDLSWPPLGAEWAAMDSSEAQAPCYELAASGRPTLNSVP
jgi:hypothetical protein